VLDGRSLARLLVSGSALLPSASAGAAQVRGVFDVPSVQAPVRTLGYAKTKVTGPAKGAGAHRQDVAVFLRVKESLPLPASEPFKVSVTGLRLVPAVAACVVDGKVTFKNEDKAPISVSVDQRPLGEIKPGESKTFDCASSDPSLRRIYVKEWPHIRGSLFIGEVGVVGELSANGGFALQAPQGKYELEVISGDGVLAKRDVEIAKGDVDVGRMSSSSAGSGGVDAAKQEPPKPGMKPAPKKPPIPAKRRPVADKPLDTQFEKGGSEP
jgi:hypothetical protein